MRHSALSLVYQSLGCFHTLQPTNNAFEPPSIPALLPHGFVRWQTIQLLLCPDEHVRFLQEAVKRFDVINPAGGGTFPKVIPREAFPAAPDPEMVEWHDTVSQRLEQDAAAKLNTAAVPPPTSRSEAFHHQSSSIDSDNSPESPDYFSRRAQHSVKGRGPRNAPYEERQTNSLPGSRRPSTVAEEPRRPKGRFDERDSYSFDNTRLRPQPSIENPPRQRRSKSSTRSDRQAKRPVTSGRQSRSRLNTVDVSSDTESVMSDEDSDSGWPKPQTQQSRRRELEMERERASRRYRQGSGSLSPTRPHHPSRLHSHDANYSDVRRRQQQRERSFSPRHPVEIDDDEVDVEDDDDLDPEEPYTIPVKPTITRNLHYPNIPPPRPPPITTTPPSTRSSRSGSGGSHSSGNNHFQTSRAPNPFKIPFREYIFPEDLPPDHDAEASAGSSGRGGSGPAKPNSKSKSKSKSKSRKQQQAPPPPPTAPEMPTARYHVPKYTTATPTPPPPPPPPQPQPISRHHSRKGRPIPQHPAHITTTALPQMYQPQPQSRPHIPTRTESDQRAGNLNIRRVRAQSHSRPPPVMASGHDRERSRWSISGMGMSGGGPGGPGGGMVWD